MTSNSYTPHVFSLHMFLCFFFVLLWAAPLNFSSSSFSTSVTRLFPQCFASAWPCNWKKPKSSGGGFHCPAGDGIMVGYYPQLLGVRKDHRAERWTQSSCHRSHQITQKQKWSCKDGRRRATPNDALLNLHSHSLAPRILSEPLFFAVWGVSMI